MQLLLIPMTPHDEVPQRDIMARLDVKAGMMDYGYNFRITRGVMAQAEMMFTMKHHPIVFCQGEGTPIVSVALDDYYHRKNVGAMSNCGHGRYCLKKDTFFSKRAESILHEAFEKRQLLRKEILEWTRQVKERSMEVIERFLDIYEAEKSQ